MSLSKRARLDGEGQLADGDDDGAHDPEAGDDVEAEENHQVLGLSLILRKILSNLRLGDLLQCSLVNKQWNYEARCVLRDLKQTYVSIYSQTACETLKRLNADLANMSVIPINGFKFTGEMGNHIDNITLSIMSQNPEHYFSNIFNRMTLKYITLNWTGESCPAVDFIAKIMHHKSNSLEELILVAVPRGFRLQHHKSNSIEELILVAVSRGFRLQLEGRPRMAHLKILDVSPLVKHTAPQLVTDILNAAPNLVQLSMDVSEDGLELVPTNKLHTIKGFLLPFYHKYHEDQLSRFFLSLPKLEQLHLRGRAPTIALNPDLLWNGLKSILESSRESLIDISIDPIASNKLLHWDNVGPFERLNRMHVVIDFYDHTEIFRESVRKINFTKLFPNVRTILIQEIILGPWEVAKYLEQTDNIIPESASGSAELIDELQVASLVDRSRINVFKSCFPQVTRVRFGRLKDRSYPYGLIFDSYAGLQKLDIDEFCLTQDMNYDAQFCGLNPEEVLELWDMDEEFLRDLNIVAVRPGVCHMQNLKKLSVNVLAFEGNVKAHGKLFLSKVTGILTFQRLPSVNVSIVLDSSIPYFDHLESYCKIDVVNLSDFRSNL